VGDGRGRFTSGPFGATLIMSKRVLLVNPVAVHYHSQIYSYEIAARELAKGNEVHVVKCNRSLIPCMNNRNARASRCEWCKSTSGYGYDILKNKGEVHVHQINLEQYMRHSMVSGLVPRFTTIEELKKYRIGGVEFGAGIGSFIVSFTREPRIDITHGTGRRLLEDLWRATAAYMLWFRDLLRAAQPSKATFFNVRISYQRVIYDICRMEGVEYEVFEVGYCPDSFASFGTTTPHNREYLKGRMWEYWNDQSVADEEKEEIAEQTFLRRRGADWELTDRYRELQNVGELPKIKGGTRLITAFTSSEDEYESVVERNPIGIFSSHTRGIKHIADLLRGDGRSQLIIRMHPNLRRLNNSQVRLTRILAGDNVTVLEPESPVDSYALIEKSDLVVTFGSTVGIEAVFWGKPSLMLGRAVWEDLPGIMYPKTVDQAGRYLLDDDWSVVRESALIYGYFEARFGFRPRYVQPDRHTPGLLMGQDLRPPLRRHLLSSILKRIGR